MPKFLVVVTDKRRSNYSYEAEVLKGCDAQMVVADCHTEEEMIAACRDADGLLVDMASVTERVIAQLKKCKVISRYGVGYDNVDVDACTKRGIYVANVPDYCMEDVSDHALALLFSCLRQTAVRDRRVRNGEWNMNLPNIYRVRGKVLSLLGFGRIARYLARKVSGFGLDKILVYDPYIDADTIAGLGACKTDLDTAVREGDFISLHMGLGESTRAMIDSRIFSMMKPTAILINTARGGLIDEDALIEALSQNRIAGAGLDTYSREPLAQDSPLKALDNCVLTDHMAYSSAEAFEDLQTKAALNIRKVLEGGKPLYPLNLTDG